MPAFDQLIFAIDRRLRRQQGVYEFSSDPGCIFRIQPWRAKESVYLSDGTSIRPGDLLLNLHIWNEHVPPIGGAGITIGWARQFGKAAAESLQMLAAYVAAERELDGMVAVRGDMRLGTKEQDEQLGRLSRHFAFEEVRARSRIERQQYRFRENVFILFLVLATNPSSAGISTLRRGRKVMYLSRQILNSRYGKIESWSPSARAAPDAASGGGD